MNSANQVILVNQFDEVYQPQGLRDFLRAKGCLAPVRRKSAGGRWDVDFTSLKTFSQMLPGWQYFPFSHDYQRSLDFDTLNTNYPKNLGGLYRISN